MSHSSLVSLPLSLFLTSFPFSTYPLPLPPTVFLFLALSLSLSLFCSLSLSFISPTKIPRQRSGVQMCVSVTDDILYVHGGYSKEKVSGQKKEGRIHEDMYVHTFVRSIIGHRLFYFLFSLPSFFPPSLTPSLFLTIPPPRHTHTYAHHFSVLES